MSGQSPLGAALKRMLAQLRTDRFGGRDAPVVTLADGTDVGDDGVLHGALEVHIACRNGEMALIHSEPLDGIADADALRDALAAALSKVLANHTAWPR